MSYGLRAGIAVALAVSLLAVPSGDPFIRAAAAVAADGTGPSDPLVTKVTPAALNATLLDAEKKESDALAAMVAAARREQDAVPAAAAAVESRPGTDTTSGARTGRGGKHVTPARTSKGERPRRVVAPAAVAGPAGGGDVTASPLSVSSTWSGGGSSGAFTWSYPLRVPAPGVGPAPSLAVSYNSGSVDGRTSATNNQGSWLGEGFDLPTSFVERSYAGCRDDGHTDSGDLCWKNDNASLVLNGKSTALVKVSEESWRLADDDGSKVQRVFDAEGAASSNGARRGERWVVTTTEGTQYWFGLEKVPGSSAGTNSVFTVPVFGDDAGEPCNASTFAASACVQAWRWNLDYVVDVHGNVAVYRYVQEKNGYARGGNPSTSVSYVRGGYLSRIEYGLRASAITANAPYKVDFTVAERCTAGSTNCATLDSAHQRYWPDVPFDAICNLDPSKPDVRCTSAQRSPAFFTRKRLVGVSTSVWNAPAGATAGYVTADAWSFSQDYLDPGDTGDTRDQTLWLSSLQQTNVVDGAKLPPVSFLPTFLANRVDTNQDGLLPLNRPRLIRVVSETGASTTVTYEGPDCPAASARVEGKSTSRCFTMKWYPERADTPKLDWFHKYVVHSVVVSDPFGNSPATTTTYTYGGGAGWRYALDPITPVRQRTWSQWRGYEKVTTVTGDGSDGPRSKTVTVYMRGLNGDRQPGTSSPRVQNVTGITAPAITDSDPLAGFVRETATYNGDSATAAEVSGSISSPWPWETAAQKIFKPGTGETDYTIRAWFVRTASTTERTAITGGSVPRNRRVISTTTYDPTYGVATQVDARTEVDPAVAGGTVSVADRTCTRLWYARDTDKGLNNLLSRKQVLSVPCSQAATSRLPATDTQALDVISDTASAFDAATTWTQKQALTKGEPRWTGRVKGYTTDRNPIWQTLTTMSYDALGRVAKTTDTTGASRTVAFTPATTLPVTSTTTTNALGHTITSAFDVRWGLPTKVTGTTGRTSETVYDSLGRVSAFWDVNLSRSGSPNLPTRKFTYSVTRSAPAWVSTTSLVGGGASTRTSYQIYDGLMRLRQTQSPSPTVGANSGVGRVLTVTEYNSRGLVRSQAGDIFDDQKAPNATLTATTTNPPAQTATAYDGAGRPTTSTFSVLGVAKWSTTTSYTGDSVATTAPAGGSASRVFTDAAGREVERRQYSGTSPTAATYVSTKKSYDPAGRLNKVTGPDEAAWTYSYDLYGRKTSSSDPDAGTSKTTYTVLDQIASTTDARGNTLRYDYDDLGRKTAEYDGAKDDAHLSATWTYDTLRKGLPTGWTKYVGGKTGRAYSQMITAYDNLNQPETTSFTLPDSDPLIAAGVPKTINHNTWRNLEGNIEEISATAVAGLSRTNLTTLYSPLGLPSGMYGIVNQVSYTATGQLEWMQLEGVSQNASVTYRYETGTNRLVQTLVGNNQAALVRNATFSYDPAGNLTAVKDVAAGAGGKADNQCFTYDGYRRMSQAWTPAAGDCAAAPSAAGLGGAAPYWLAWTYTKAGQRATETQTTPAGGVSTTTYTYGTGTGHPHALASTSTTTTGSMTGAVAASAGPTVGSGVGTGGAAGTRTFTYDPSGNPLTRQTAAAGPVQSMTWDSWGRMASNSQPATTGTTPTPARDTRYLYTPDGELLLKRPALETGPGETVLYVGGTEIHWTKTATTSVLTGTRRITFAGRVIAVESGTAGVLDSKTSFQIADEQGTGIITIDRLTLNVTRRYTTPFGTTRGTPASPWPYDHGFLDKTSDPTTNLTHIGAREYDPTLGQFLSVDPVLDTADPQSLNGYAYANNNPVAFPDPTGTDAAACSGIPACLAANGGSSGIGSKPTGALSADGLSGGLPDAPSRGNSSANSEERRIQTYKIRHDAAQAYNFGYILSWAAQSRVKMEFPVPGGSGGISGNTGYVDIVKFDSTGRGGEIWEVKRVSGLFIVEGVAAGVIMR
ncbi:MAG: RHS repeat-associated core domain-containing protein [Kineosporiaceae bacterium]